VSGVQTGCPINASFATVGLDRPFAQIGNRDYSFRPSLLGLPGFRRVRVLFLLGDGIELISQGDLHEAVGV